MAGICESDNQPRLGTLLKLLHDADHRFLSVEATFRTSSRSGSPAASQGTNSSSSDVTGASVAHYGRVHALSGPAQEEEFLHVWRAGDRVREEHEGGRQDGSYGVRDGKRWWRWHPRSGIASNEDDPELGSDVGQQLWFMFNPALLMSLLRFRVIGCDSVAGRAAVTAEAKPRAHDGLFAVGLNGFIDSAESYTLAVDARRGIILRITAMRADHPFRETVVTEVAFDQPIPDERFHFQPPAH